MTDGDLLDFEVSDGLDTTWPPTDAYWLTDEYALRLVKLPNSPLIYTTVLLPDGRQFEMRREDGFIYFLTWPGPAVFTLMRKYAMNEPILEQIREDLDGPPVDIIL